MALHDPKPVAVETIVPEKAEQKDESKPLTVFTDERASLPPPPYSQHSPSVSSKVQEWLKINHADEPGQIKETQSEKGQGHGIEEWLIVSKDTEESEEMPSAALEDALIEAEAPAQQSKPSQKGKLGLSPVATFEFSEQQVEGLYDDVDYDSEAKQNSVEEEEIQPSKKDKLSNKLSLSSGGGSSSTPVKGDMIVIREIPPTPGTPEEEGDDLVFIDSLGKHAESANAHTERHIYSADDVNGVEPFSESRTPLASFGGETVITTECMPEETKQRVDSATSMNGDLSKFGGETVVTTECLPDKAESLAPASSMPQLSRQIMASTEVAASTSSLNLSRHTVATTECVPADKDTKKSLKSLKSESSATGLSDDSATDRTLTLDSSYADKTGSDSADAPKRPESAPPNTPASPALHRKSSASSATRRRSSSSRSSLTSPTKKSPTSPTKSSAPADWAASLRSYAGKDMATVGRRG